MATSPLYRDAQMCGARIRHVREAKQLTLKELAAKTGFTHANLSKVENGRINTPIETLTRIARALGVSAAEFFRDDDGAPMLIKADTLMVPAVIYERTREDLQRLRQRAQEDMETLLNIEHRHEFVLDIQ
jgi:transcriptional regulator with XRE-family HTH domain